MGPQGMPGYPGPPGLSVCKYVIFEKQKKTAEWVFSTKRFFSSFGFCLGLIIKIFSGTQRKVW